MALVRSYPTTTCNTSVIVTKVLVILQRTGYQPYTLVATHILSEDIPGEEEFPQWPVPDLPLVIPLEQNKRHHR